ncbi:hypothetical protein M422DRAFT_220720 [Sphaerobolus stellatus SS14]|nr:hypothetical protein M422DRAFT_220720 [Sphaerobolus stellatus SS14]
MFEQIPSGPPYNKESITHHPQVRDYMTMLHLINHILFAAPEFRTENGAIALPINAILTWPMGTPDGLIAFRNPNVNSQFKRIFAIWADFLCSSDSRYVLNQTDYGWLGPKAMKWMPDFAEIYECEPYLPYYGFKPWGDFFTREFRSSVRPVASPEDDSIITNACESTVYRIARNVRTMDQFWLKSHPYSLEHMLNHDPLVSQLAGGTIYQGILSALNYHRWHNSVNGTIHKIVMIPGTYYAQSPSDGFAGSRGPDFDAPTRSQGFITAVAMRALVFIQADDELVGMAYFMAVGMVEVSSCEVTVRAGMRVRKGDQLGMFHFGGSSHCLIFRPEASVVFEKGVGERVEINAVVGRLVER